MCQYLSLLCIYSYSFSASFRCVSAVLIAVTVVPHNGWGFVLDRSTWGEGRQGWPDEGHGIHVDSLMNNIIGEQIMQIQKQN